MKSLQDIFFRRALPEQIALALHRPDLAARLNPRAARIILLLIAVAILNGLDLVFTLYADSIGELRELNPLADYLLRLGQTFSLVCFKILMVVVGFALMWRCRRSPWSVPACWILLVAFCALSVLWIAWIRSTIATLTLQTLFGTYSRF